MTIPSKVLLGRIEKCFPNQGMRKNAAFIAALHPNAIDYLEQAPVLAMAFGIKHNSRADRLYVASRIGGPIARGERLRAVMAAVALPLPLRKLRSTALFPTHRQTIRRLAEFDASTLSQTIPETAGKQREWFYGLGRFYDRCRNRHFTPAEAVLRWVLRHTAIAGASRHEIGDFADFLYANPDAPLERWGWERAQLEVALWHDHIALEGKMPPGIKPDTQIDYSDWPEYADLAGYEFFKLATPSSLIEEGRRMRHCVGSYIADVMNGGTSIFSIRHEMRRVATCQITGTRISQIKAFANKVPPRAAEAAAHLFIELHKKAAA